MVYISPRSARLRPGPPPIGKELAVKTRALEHHASAWGQIWGGAALPAKTLIYTILFWRVYCCKFEVSSVSFAKLCCKCLILEMLSQQTALIFVFVSSSASTLNSVKVSRSFALVLVM